MNLRLSWLRVKRILCRLILVIPCVLVISYISVLLNPMSILWRYKAFQIASCYPCDQFNASSLFRNGSVRKELLSIKTKTNLHARLIDIINRVDHKKEGHDGVKLGPKVPVCDKLPQQLVGPFSVDLDVTPSFKNNKDFDDVKPGGIWTPSTCSARQRTAIIIPYRDREKHLQILLYYLIPMLKRQHIDFQIFVVEQYGHKVFNKGVLLNSGFLEVWNYGDFDCIIFHDVDTIPVNDYNMYVCEIYPRHMSPEIDKFHYELPYVMLVGGVFSMPPDIYIAINGYSNMYWGWGGEDDDMAFRIYESKLGVVRPPATVGRYKMFKHDEREESEQRKHLMRQTKDRFRTDGVNSVDYGLVFRNNTSSRFFTHIMIDVGQQPAT